MQKGQGSSCSSERLSLAMQLGQADIYIFVKRFPFLSHDRADKWSRFVQRLAQRGVLGICVNIDKF